MTLDDAVRQGEQLRDAGIKLSADHAELNEPGWQEEAFRLFRIFLDAVTRGFQTEEARSWAESHGLNDPPDKRAWGGIIRRAAREGLILRAGFALANDPKSHRAPSTVWRKV